MADDSESSSDESYVGEDRIQGYQFEPRRQDDSSSSDENSGEAESSDSDGAAATIHREGRMTMLDWCSCDHCSLLLVQSDKECVCCKERQATRDKAAANAENEQECVTNNKDFEILCLTPAVLRNVLVGLNNIRMDNWQVNPPNNRAMRYAGYRQFTWWVHGRLGLGRRRVIPACAAWKIRQTFPKDDDEEYTGFASGNESD